MNVTVSFVETPNDGGGDGTDNRPMNGEPELACIVQDQEMEEGDDSFLHTVFLLKFSVIKEPLQNKFYILYTTHIDNIFLWSR